MPGATGAAATSTLRWPNWGPCSGSSSHTARGPTARRSGSTRPWPTNGPTPACSTPAPSASTRYRTGYTGTTTTGPTPHSQASLPSAASPTSPASTASRASSPVVLADRYGYDQQLGTAQVEQEASLLCGEAQHHLGAARAAQDEGGGVGVEMVGAEHRGGSAGGAVRPGLGQVD